MTNENDIRIKYLKLKSDYDKVVKQNNALKKQVKYFQEKSLSQSIRIANLEKQLNNIEEKNKEEIQRRVQGAINMTTQNLTEHFNKLIRELEAKISKMESVLTTDSSNSSLPSSKNRIGKKVIPNNREKSGKKIGGQKGHTINKLESFNEEEITNVIEHTLEACPYCNGKIRETTTAISDIIDINIEVTKTRNIIHNYNCSHCHKRISANENLPRGVSYGSNLNAICLSLLNESNNAYNKVSKHISGITNNEINISQGYLVKLQKRASEKLETFIPELKRKIISQDVVFWDDTTVKIQKEEINEEDESKTKQGIIRFYGNDKYALLIGHKDKSMEGIDEDNILNNLGSKTTCMHDHVLLNYNEKYKFKNAECNVHILRYLKGISDNLPDHTWQKEMSNLLKKLNNERKEEISKKESCFNDNYINDAYEKYSLILSKAYKENAKTKDYIYYKEEELNLIKRLDKYKDNHLLFLKDFTVPFDNNLSEGNIRKVKRKMVVSFMFKNIPMLQSYAKITSYLETCYNHNVTKFNALKRLLDNNPYSIEELENI